jgi:hypothetical protein
MEYGLRMNGDRAARALSVCGLLLAAAGWAEVSSVGNPAYRVIVVRNPFGLKPAPTNSPADLAKATPPAVPVNVKLSGIINDSSGRRVWLLIPPPTAKGPVTTPPTNAPLHFALREGDVQADIQVLEINPRQNTVKILNAGVPVTLDFTNHASAAVAATAAPPGGTPGYPRATPGAGPNPAGLPVPPKTAAVNAAQPFVQPASFAAGGGNPLANVGAVADASAGALRTIPSRPTRVITPEPQTLPQDYPSAPQVDPAVQAALAEQQQREAQARGVFLPPLPPISR